MEQQNSDPAAIDSPDESVSPPPAPDHGRPPHTVLSIVLIGLVAAATLYGVRASVQVSNRVVQSWDFRNVAPEEAPWTFPNLKKEQDGNGIQFLKLDTGPGPELVMDVDTTAVRKIRVTMEVLRMPEETPVPFQLEWYWAGAEDVAAAGENWPYSTERGTAFRVRDRRTPNVHTANVADHERWSGTIARAFIGLKFPASEPGPFLARLLRVEFVE